MNPNLFFLPLAVSQQILSILPALNCSSIISYSYNLLNGEAGIVFITC
ncbi:hypothetical protein ES705_37969 [subsurface metagenome]